MSDFPSIAAPSPQQLKRLEHDNSMGVCLYDVGQRMINRQGTSERRRATFCQKRYVREGSRAVTSPG